MLRAEVLVRARAASADASAATAAAAQRFGFRATLLCDSTPVLATHLASHKQHQRRQRWQQRQSWQTGSLTGHLARSFSSAASPPPPPPSSPPPTVDGGAIADVFQGVPPPPPSTPPPTALTGMVSEAEPGAGSRASAGGQLEAGVGSEDIGTQASASAADATAVDHVAHLRLPGLGEIDLPFSFLEQPAHEGDWFYSIGKYSADLIEAVQGATGLPFVACIALVAVGFRVAVLPIAVYQQRMTAKMFNLGPKLNHWREVSANMNYTPEIRQDAMFKAKNLMSENGIKMQYLFLPVLFQAPFFMSFFFGLRILAGENPDFASGGSLWFADLAANDATALLPLMSGAALLASLEVNSRGTNSVPQSPNQRMFMRSLAFVIVPAGLGFPSCVTFYWAINNSFSAAQMFLMKNPILRAHLGIPQISLAAKEAQIAKLAAEAAAAKAAKGTATASGGAAAAKAGFWNSLKATAETAAQVDDNLRKAKMKDIRNANRANARSGGGGGDGGGGGKGGGGGGGGRRGPGGRGGGKRKRR